MCCGRRTCASRRAVTKIRGGDYRGDALRGRAHPDAGGAAEQIDDGTNGFIVPFEDSAALAERLYTLLSDPDYEADERRQFGEGPNPVLRDGHSGPNH